MNWAESLENVKKAPTILALGLCVAGAGGFYAGVTWLDGRIQSKIKDSEYLRGQIKTIETRAAIPGPKGDPGPTGPIGAPGSKGDPGLAITIPPGAVVAFDIREGCPKGWIAFEPAERRSIVGATPRPMAMVPAMPFQDSGNFSPKGGTYFGGQPDGTYGNGLPDSKVKSSIFNACDYKPCIKSKKTLSGTESGYVYTEPLDQKNDNSLGFWFSPDLSGGRDYSFGSVFQESVALHYCKKIPENP